MKKENAVLCVKVLQSAINVLEQSVKEEEESELPSCSTMGRDATLAGLQGFGLIGLRQSYNENRSRVPKAQQDFVEGVFRFYDERQYLSERQESSLRSTLSTYGIS